MDMDTLDHILNLNGATDYLLSESWRETISHSLLREAEAFLQYTSPLGFEVIPYHDSDAIEIEASFQQSPRRYHQTCLSLFIPPVPPHALELSSTCSCHESSICKHAVALLLYTVKQLHAYPKTPQTGPFIPPDIRGWLHHIESIKKKENKPKGKPSNQSLAYCIMFDNLDEYAPVFEIRLCKHLKSGDVIDTFTTPTANPQKPAKYMVEADIYPCTLYRQIHNPYFSSDVVLNSHLSAVLLDAAIQTNRLYLIEDLDISEQDAKLISLGKKISPELTWLTQADGSAKPSLNLPPHCKIIPTTPPYALDTHQLVIHPLSNKNHSTNTLLEWAQGPSIPAEIIHTLLPDFKRINLPQPKALEQKSLPPTSPVPHLTL